MHTFATRSYCIFFHQCVIHFRFHCLFHTNFLLVIVSNGLRSEMTEIFFCILSGPNVKNTVAILNCLLAKQLCQDDASCSAIQHIIPKVCGIEQGKYESIQCIYLYKEDYNECSYLIA